MAAGLLLEKILLLPTQNFQVDSDDDRIPDEKYIEDLSKKLPQGTDKTPEVLETALQGVSPR